MKNKHSADKPIKLFDEIEVIYDSNRWILLKKLRDKAEKIMKVLQEAGLEAMVHGSIARGDVDAYSDIDIIIPYVIPSHKVEAALTLKNFIIYSKKMTQATPSHTIKAHLYLDPLEKVSVTFPLLPFKDLELEFYRFGGLASLKELITNIRVPGCTKKLTFIEPTLRGHKEFSIIGREKEVAKKLNISIEIINERIRVLTRRDKIGRTGVFLDKKLRLEESFEYALKELMDNNPAIRRVYSSRVKE
ncbi:MAG: nucleotidyltransferase domain-containing protein [Candidatus Bathyarchaeia archaeon]|nr:nucleotidyltransferase domain-containing protein [Candidatus Bathyarchaeota archaeon]